MILNDKKMVVSLLVEKDILIKRITDLEGQILGSNEEWRTLKQALRLLQKHIDNIVGEI